MPLKAVFFLSLFFMGRLLIAQEINADSAIADFSRLFPDSTSENLSTDDYNSQLLIAAFDGDALKVRELLQKGADVNTETYWDELTPLIYAAQNGHLKTVKTLVANGAMIDKRPSGGVSPMIIATLMKHDSIVEYLIHKGGNIDITDDDSVTSLMYASSYNHFVLAHMLLYYGANTAKEDVRGVNSLMAACYNSNIEIINLLINKGANLDSKDKYGFTPLMYAVESGDTNVVKLLLKRGASINVKNNSGLTALSVASKLGAIEVAEILIISGADVNLGLSSRKNIRPMYFASGKEMKKLLIKNGAKRDVKPNFNKVTIGLGTDWSFNDFMFDFNLGVHDKKYKTGISAGYSWRVGKDRTLYEADDNIWYQYWEWRSYFYLGIEKRVYLVKLNNDTKLGIVAGVKEFYTFGKLKATKTKARRTIGFAPLGGIFTENQFAEFRIGYEYLDFGIEKVSPHRFNIGCIFIIDSDKYDTEHKMLEWITG